jgi:hypothetical protein
MDDWSPRQLCILAGMLFAGILAVLMEQKMLSAPPAKEAAPAEVFAQRNPFPQVSREVMDSLTSQPSSSVNIRTLGEPIFLDMRDSVVDMSTHTSTARRYYTLPSPKRSAH